MNEVFRVGFINRWERPDPRQGMNFASFLVPGHVYEAPYRLSSESSQVKRVLLDYPLQRESGAEGMAYSAGVRQGVFFSDGTPLTAEHVAASLEKTPAFKLHASVAAHGDRVFFKLKRPNARFEFALVRYDHCVVLEKGNQLLGTGPYMVASDARPDCYRLVRNPHFKSEVRLPEIECRVYPLDAEGRRQKLLDAVNRGEVDFTDELARDELNRVERMRKCIDLGYCTALLYFNTERPLFADSRVRMACATAIDRKSLAARSYSNALAFSATGTIPPALGSTPDLITHDPRKARELLGQANVKPSRLLMVTIPTPRPYLSEPRATAELVAAQLGQLGFQIDIKQPRDLAEYRDIGRRGDYDLLLAGWIPDTPDPLDFMDSLLNSHCVPSANEVLTGTNLSRWRNAAMDEALAKQRLQPDQKTWERIGELVRNEVPMFPLMYGPRVAVVSWRARNFPRDFGNGPFLAQVELPVNGQANG